MINISLLQNLGVPVLIEIVLALFVIPSAIVTAIYAKKMKPGYVILAFMMMEMPFLVLGVFSQILGAKMADEMAKEVVDEASRTQFLAAAQAESMKAWYIPIFMILFLGAMMAIAIMRSRKATQPQG